MLPSLHPVQDAILLLRREAIEALQTLAQLLLLIRLQVSELWIILQSLLLLILRNTLILA